MQQSDYSLFMYILRPLALALKHCEPKIPLSADRCSLCLAKSKCNRATGTVHPGQVCKSSYMENLCELPSADSLGCE